MLEGVYLAVAGMGTVFLFLGLLFLAAASISFLARLREDSRQVGSVPSAGDPGRRSGEDVKGADAEIAAVVAAVCCHEEIAGRSGAAP